MSKVPEIPQFKPTKTDTAIYCFPPGTSEADKQHDIAEINKFIEYVKAKKKKAEQRQALARWRDGVNKETEGV
jgi:hypothetical protein